MRVISIPVSLLWKIKMPLRQKLALMGIFSLTLFVVIISIVRVAVIRISDRVNVDQTWLFVWANVEMGVGKGERLNTSLSANPCC